MFVLYLHRMYEKDKADVWKTFKHSQSLFFNTFSGFFSQGFFTENHCADLQGQKYNLFPFYHISLAALPVRTIKKQCAQFLRLVFNLVFLSAAKTTHIGRKVHLCAV